MKPNGQDKFARPNGHALLSSSREASGVRLEAGGAASDDARDFSAAAAPSCAAGMGRGAYAEVAPLRGKRRWKTGGESGPEKRLADEAELRAAGKSPAGDEEKSMIDIPPGEEPLPADGPGFVDAMHAHVDLYLACARLVKSSDEKIAQRMVERLLEMSYGKSPSQQSEEAAPVSYDAPPAPGA